MDADGRRYRTAVFVTALVACVGMAAAPVQAGLGLANAEATGTMAPPGLDDDAHFGAAVDSDGTTLVVGAPGEGLDGRGEVFVYQRGTNGRWSIPQVIRAPNNADAFGASVSVSGSTIVVGAPQSHAGASYAGAAYVFIPGAFGWDRQATLTLPSPQSGAALGGSVAIDGDTVVVGAHRYDRAGTTNAGAAFVSARDGLGWTSLVPLATPPPEKTAHFGASVAVDGTNLLVGAPQENADGLVNAGAAYAYVGSEAAWSGPLKLTASDAHEGALFGKPVAVDGATAVVGARDASPDGVDEAGAVYVFDGSGAWIEEARLVAPSPQAGASFGHAVAVDGNVVLVGSPHYDVDIGDRLRSSAGRAHLFARGGAGGWQPLETLSQGQAEAWDEYDSIEARETAYYDRFGQSVTLSPLGGAVGAPFDEVEDTGSVRTFQAP